MIGRWTLSVVSSALASDPREAVRRARALGFGGLLFDAFSSAIDLTALSTSARREFMHLVSSHQQKLVALRFDLDPKGLGGGDVDQVLARFDRVLEAAAGLQAGCVCTDFGFLPATQAKPQPRPQITPQQAGLIILPDTIPESPRPEPHVTPPDPQLAATMAGALVELGRRADRYSVPVALSSSFSGFASVYHALGAAGCPWFGIDLDPLAILRDPWNLDEVFSHLGELIRHVRARDAVIGDDRRTRPAVIGQGSVNWHALVAALDDAGYAGPLTIDPVDLPDRVAGAISGKRFLFENMAKSGRD